MIDVQNDGLLGEPISEDHLSTRRDSLSGENARERFSPCSLYLLGSAAPELMAPRSALPGAGGS